MILSVTFTFLTYVPVGTVIVPLILFDIWPRVVNIFIQKKNLMLPLLKSPVGLAGTDTLPGAFSWELGTGLLLWAFQTDPVYSLWTKEMALIASEIADYGTCRGGILVYFVPVRFCQVLLNRLFSSIVTIILPHSVTFVEKRKCHGSILSKQLHEKCR